MGLSRRTHALATTLCLSVCAAAAGGAPGGQVSTGGQRQPASLPAGVGAKVGYETAFLDLYIRLGLRYPCFKTKDINWRAVGQELLPRASKVKTDKQFCLLCMELVARLEDSHAHLLPGTAKPEAPPMPRWGTGLACLTDDRGKPVVYYVRKGSPAEAAGVKVGMALLSVNGEPAAKAVEARMKRISRYRGYSSKRYLRYDAVRRVLWQRERGVAVSLRTLGTGKERAATFKLAATLAPGYLPRLPVPIKGIAESRNVSWRMLGDKIGYIYVRRIRRDLIASLDRAVKELGGAKGLIVDVRGNSGGGFDAKRSHRNFAPDDPAEASRPRFKGPIALLINERCISAGEGWASWFTARKRARVFGTPTAGASARKDTYTLKNGLYKVRFPVKHYRGFLRRPIERRGLEPDVLLRQTAEDLAAGRDTVLEAAKQYLLKAK